MIALGVTLFLLFSLGVTSYLFQRSRDLRSKALNLTNQINFYGNPVNFLKMFGQVAYGETAEGTVVAKRLFHASGVIVDKSSRPNKIYVADTGNNRILGFDSLGVCQNETTTKCTNNSDCQSGACVVNSTKNADMVIGQPDFRMASCNGDNNLGIYKNPSAASLCLIGFPQVTNTGEYWMRTNFDVDADGNLYLPDVWNNRILVYFQPFSADKSNGKGDAIADFVIGQEGFDKNGINKGLGPNARNAESLYLSFGGVDHVAARGVSVDNNGNIWVADTFNGRVLRFPRNSKTSDLVLGKNSFNSPVDYSNCSTNPGVPDFDKNYLYRPLNKMCTPTLAKIDPETGDLYVIDESARGFQARILVFKPPFTNGMIANRMIVPKINSLEGVPAYWSQITGFVFNTYKEGEYAQGKIWINEHQFFRSLLLDEEGNIIKTIGAVNKNKTGCDRGNCGKIPERDYAKEICWPGGSIGLDNLNNIYFGDEGFQKIDRFALPYETTRIGSDICLPDANGGLFDGWMINSITGYGGRGSVGAFSFGNQLVMRDHGRFLVWNDYLNKNLGAKSDLVAGKPNEFAKEGGDRLGARGTYAIDDLNKMWLYNADGKIAIYQLPLQNGSRFIADNVPLYWTDDGTQVDYGGFEAGMTFDKLNKKLWIVDRSHHRLLRISNYSEFGNRLSVDMVIGQRNKAETKCNHNQTYGWRASGSPTADSLCDPTVIKFDHFGNLYVIENTYECHGNDRITVFMADDLRNAAGLFPQIAAKKVFISSNLTQKWVCNSGWINQPYSPVALAFNKKNNMVIGNDGYYGDQKVRQYRQLWFYADPLKKNADGSFIQGQKPDAYINLPMGASGEINFDDQDNLIIQDHTWPKVWVINLDKDSSWLIPVNKTPTPTPVPTSTPTPNPTPTPTPTPMPTATPTPQIKSIVLNLVSDSDDANENADINKQVITDAVNLKLGWYANLGLRFQDSRLVHLKGKTIRSAKIHLTPISTTSQTLKLRIQAENKESCQTFIQESNNIGLRQKTNNYTDWEPSSWSLNSRVNTPDISPLITEVLQRPNFTGQSLCLFVQNIGSPDYSERRVSAKEDTPRTPATLSITYY